ncbi:MAG: isoprenyl transferase [Alphaproteobacteria bacterium]
MEFAKLPQHVAFIMDGNGRWAQRIGLLRLEGHRRGIKTVENMAEEAKRLGIPYVTFYAFSTENWQRPFEEVSGLMNLLREFFTQRLAEIAAKNIRIRFIGDRRPEGKLPADVLAIMGEAEEKTAHNTGVTLIFAINYSGRDELKRAMGYFAEDVQAGVKTPWSLDEEGLAKYLDTATFPDPDLLIRTSGEERISNFLLWQLAYTELVFHETPWPDFTVADFHDCLSEYVSRDRRFGKVAAPSKPDDIVE